MTCTVLNCSTAFMSMWFCVLSMLATATAHADTKKRRLHELQKLHVDGQAVLWRACWTKQYGATCLQHTRFNNASRGAVRSFASCDGSGMP